jgi:maltokinase
MSDDRHALMVACSRYEDQGLTELRTPARDAEALEAVLADPTIGDYSVQTVLNQPAHVVSREIEGFLSAGGRDDLLLLYLSCHGLKDETGQLYFAASNTERRFLTSTGIRAEFVNELMNRSFSRRIVLLLDCCYSGVFTRGMTPKGSSEIHLMERFNGVGRGVISASSAMEYAFEGESSLFTSMLVEGLRTGEADLDEDGQVSIEDLYHYVDRRVREHNPNQRPELWVSEDTDALLLAHSPRTPRPPAEVSKKDRPPLLPLDLLRAVRTELPEALVGYLPNQRWYSGRGRRLRRAPIQLLTPLSGGSPALIETIVTAIFADGGVERYQVPCGLRTGDDVQPFVDRFPEALIASFEWAGRPAIIYDAVYDPDLGPVLLSRLAEESKLGELKFQFQPLEVDSPDELRAGSSRLLSGEQSNSSLVLDDRYILKLFRRLYDGENPELEVSKFLAAAGFTAFPELLGWIQIPGFTLGVLQRFYPDSETGWEVAVKSVAEAYRLPHRELSTLERDFSSDSSRLGALTADLHIAFARSMETVTEDEADLAQTSVRMRTHLQEAAHEVRSLQRYRPAIEEVYNAVDATEMHLQLQRIHGDYHLNQVLHIGAHEWLVIDFEGEPVRNLEERRRLATPLRDVAGMCRSFDYVASHPLLGRRDANDLEQRAMAWSRRNKDAFLEGYRARALPAGLLPDGYELLLLACEMDKAVYEVAYEARYRPEWLPIPFLGIQRLLASLEEIRPGI